MNSIPYDLILDIFSRLSINTIARCRCVSKLWWSILHHQDFTELFLTRSSARPRLLFYMENFYEGDLVFFSLPQPQHPYEKMSSLVVTAEFHMKLHMNLEFGGHASGLFSFSGNSSVDEDTLHVICNPSTGQCRSLPKLKYHKHLQSFLGFDPIHKQFKILLMAELGDHRIMTLGTEKMRWRKIQCPLAHDQLLYYRQICINGVLYYIATRYDTLDDMVIVCFDVRSEEFKFIDDANSFLCCPFNILVNYKGKLGVINWNYYSITIELHVLENFEKQEFSKYVYTLPENKFGGWNHISIVGVTASGEFVLSSTYTSTFLPFYVVYFNPDTKTLQRIEILGLGDYSEGGDSPYHNRVFGFVDHIEDLRFDLKYAATLSKAHIQQDRHTFESINNFDAMCLSDEDEFTGVKT